MHKITCNHIVYFYLCRFYRILIYTDSDDKLVRSCYENNDSFHHHILILYIIRDCMLRNWVFFDHFSCDNIHKFSFSEILCYWQSYPFLSKVLFYEYECRIWKIHHIQNIFDHRCASSGTQIVVDSYKNWCIAVTYIKSDGKVVRYC